MFHTPKKKILLCIDGSAHSFDAARYVGRLLCGQHVHITLFHTMSTISHVFIDMGIQPISREQLISMKVWEQERKKSVNAFMQKAYEILIDENIPKAHIEAKIQNRKIGVARDIINESRNGYCAVVVGRKGTSKLKELILGSIAIKVIESVTHIPVWIIGGKPDAARLVIGMDSSAGAMKAVGHVAAILGGTDIEMLLLHIIRWIDIVEAFDAWKGWAVDKRVYKAAQDSMQSVFEDATERFTAFGFDPERISTRFVTEAASRAGTIIDIAQKNNYGTIVIGRRGISKVKEFLMGRVSNKLIHLAREQAVWVVT